MIFFENNSAKIFILVVMVALASGFIFFGYLKSDPFPKMTNNNEALWKQVSEGVSDDVVEIKNNLELGAEQAKEYGDELNKESDRQALLDQAKEYAEAKLASSTATSTASSSLDINQ